MAKTVNRTTDTIGDIARNMVDLNVSQASALTAAQAARDLTSNTPAERTLWIQIVNYYAINTVVPTATGYGGSYARWGYH